MVEPVKKRLAYLFECTCKYQALLIYGGSLPVSRKFSLPFSVVRTNLDSRVVFQRSVFSLEMTLEIFDWRNWRFYGDQDRFKVERHKLNYLGTC